MNFKEFFKIRDGLWIEQSFLDLVVNKAEESQPVETKHIDIEPGPSNQTMTPLSEIKERLGQNYFFSESTLCATFQKLIEEQWGGKTGKLINEGDNNCFLTPSCAIRVYWYRGDNSWNITITQDEDGNFGPGERIFAPVE